MAGGQRHKGQGERQRNNARAALRAERQSDAAATAQAAGQMVARLVLDARGLPDGRMEEQWTAEFGLAFLLAFAAVFCVGWLA